MEAKRKTWTWDELAAFGVIGIMVRLTISTVLLASRGHSSPSPQDQWTLMGYVAREVLLGALGGAAFLGTITVRRWISWDKLGRRDMAIAGLVYGLHWAVLIVIFSTIVHGTSISQAMASGWKWLTAWIVFSALAHTFIVRSGPSACGFQPKAKSEWPGTIDNSSQPER